MMGSSRKDILHLEHKNPTTTSRLESTLLVCKKDSQNQTRVHPPDGKLVTTAVSQSQVLGKVKGFLGVISEANKRLRQDAESNSQNYDIEVLTGNESNVIEMDLMLGIADLHTPDAIAAAESAIASGQQLVSLDSSCSETESEDKSDDENDDVASDDDNNAKRCTFSPKLSKDGPREAAQNSRLKKKPKIIEMS